MPKSAALADLIANLDSTAPKDYDPEDILEPLNDHNNNSEEDSEAEDNGARDHYVAVGKSKLRNEQPLLDDPRYAGKRTSRKDIYSEDEEDEEIEEDIISGSENDDDSNDDDEDLLANANSDEEEISDEEQFGEGSEEEESGDEEENKDAEGDDEIDAELRRIQEEEKQMISQLSKSAQSDVEKGQHVRQQLTLWDNCLENRIRMQKVVDDANKLPQKDGWMDFLAKTEGVEKDLENAKNDLRQVIDDLIDIRTDLFTQNGSVDISSIDFNTRKRHLDDDDEYIEKLWDDISQINDVFVPFRNSTLEKWSNKVQVAAGARLNKKFKAFDQNIMSQIENAMADKSGLIKRTQLQRSDYKIIGKVEVTAEEEEQDTGKKPDRHLNTYDTEIFDDQDFYQQQLRELIESRMVDTDDPMAIGMRWAARKQTEQKKKKKDVDRKASKGRQLRFNVHEKLQNFMAPTPLGTWHETMVEELYTSLLGQKLGGESLEE
ncbi:apoptosis antagonizing transcription factor-domain-containing protein [Pilaira anomala]|nr:apoptosis antagonizing transcription factor-domain-containing protein [Pilaira anomala]